MNFNMMLLLQWRVEFIFWCFTENQNAQWQFWISTIKCYPVVAKTEGKLNHGPKLTHAEQETATHNPLQH